MFRLVFMEIKRLRTSKSMYFTLLAYVITFFMAKPSFSELTHKPATLTDVIGCYSGGTLLLLLFIPIFVSSYIQLDYHSGHIKNIVTATKDKGSFISIKLAALSFLSFVCMLITTVALYLYAVFTLDGGVTIGNPLEAILTFTEVYMMFLFVHCLYILFSILFHKELFALLLDWVVVIGIPIGITLIPNQMSTKIASYMVLNNLTDAGAVTSIGMRLLFLGLSLVYVIVLTIIMKTILRKRDIQV